MIPILGLFGPKWSFKDRHNDFYAGEAVALVQKIPQPFRSALYTNLAVCNLSIHPSCIRDFGTSNLGITPIYIRVISTLPGVTDSPNVPDALRRNSGSFRMIPPEYPRAPINVCSEPISGMLPSSCSLPISMRESRILRYLRKHRKSGRPYCPPSHPIPPSAVATERKA